MNLTPEQLEECYGLLGDGPVVFEGEEFKAERKRWAADQVIQAFRELTAEYQEAPGFICLRSRTMSNLRAKKEFNANGDIVCGFILEFLAMAALSALIGWCVRLLLDWLVEHYTEQMGS